MEDVKIFISYSHDDTELFNTFKKEIENHSKNSKQIKWDLWSDVEIPVGSLWHETIQESVQQSKAAILLVSASFFASDYIKNEEFLKFVEKNKQEGFIFFPILLSDCDFSQWEELVKIQFFNPKGYEYGVGSFKNKIVPYDYVDEQKYKNTYHKNCVAAFEKAVIKNRNRQQLEKTSDRPLIEVLSNENVLNALRLFQKHTTKKELTQKELAEAIDIKIKLYDAIFHDFDIQLEKSYSKESSFAIFDRTIAFEKIKNPDINLIQNFRNNKSISYRERSLIVSGLTISVLNYFDINKIHLLLDFITDFEDEVWQKALVGLLLAIIRHNNRLSLYPEISRRFKELKQIPNVQQDICLVDKILHCGGFSAKAAFKNNRNYVIHTLRIIFGNTITLTSKDILEIQSYIEHPHYLLDNKILKEAFPKDIIDELSYIIEIQGSITMDIFELLDFYNLDKLIEFSELNPLNINFNNELYKTPQNWFYPFENSDTIKNILANDYPSINIDASDYIDIIQNSSLPDIEKVYILTHMNEFSEDFISDIGKILVVSNNLNDKNISKSGLLYCKIIRDIYRFSKLSVISNTNNLLEEKITLYDKSLLEKITDDVTTNKIKAQYLYDNEEYQNSLNSLQDIPLNQYDFEIYSLFVNIYLIQEKYDEALPYLSELIKLLHKDIDLNKKGDWYERATLIYYGLGDNSKYFEYLEKEISVREEISKKSLDNNEYDQEKTVHKLAKTYWRLSAAHWNRGSNKSQALYYGIKYLNVFFSIPDFDNYILQEEIKSNRKNIMNIFKMEIFQITFPLVKTDIEQEIKPLLFTKLLKLLKISDSKIDIDSVKQTKYYKKLSEHIATQWNTMATVVQNVNTNHPNQYENIIIPFTGGKKLYKVLFHIDILIENKEDCVLKTLFSFIFEKKKEENFDIVIDDFLNNLLSEETSSYQTIKIDEVINEMLNLSVPPVKES